MKSFENNILKFIGKHLYFLFYSNQLIRLSVSYFYSEINISDPDL